GEMSLDGAATAAAVEGLAARAQMDPELFAEGILAISNAAMADAMRTITVSEGVDPRDFTLVAFGGAGPMAAAFLAEELDIREVLVPRFPGTFSAWGMLQTDLRRDVTLSFFRAAAGVAGDELEAAFAELEREGHDAVLAEGIDDDKIHCRRSADMRYAGQEYTINIPLAAGMAAGEIASLFHDAHRQRYGHASPAAPIEFVNLRVAAIGEIGKYRGEDAPAREGDPVAGEREAVFQGQRHRTAVLLRDRLREGFTFDGPAIIEEQSATTVMPPGWTLTVDAKGNLLLQKGATA
ncbi:MAG TPA: hydantoinase/oxoprolinase family protein, partial [Pseudohaliea sp.]|nr:hydantoinase/oxoprolinase family protein [Pseudohaliea sp.]